MAETKEFDTEAFLEALGQPGKVPTITLHDGKKVMINKVTAKNLVGVIEVLKTFATLIDLKSFNDMERIVHFTNDPIQFLTVLQSMNDRVRNVIGDLCSIGRNNILDVELDDLVLIAWAEWQVNYRFFTERMIPMFSRLNMGVMLENTLGVPQSESSETPS